MCATCQSCGSELVNLNNGKNNMENQSFLKLDNGGGTLSCKFCGGMQERDSLKQGSLRPRRTAMISTTSLSISDSSISSYGDFSAEENSHDRINREEHTLYSSKEDTHSITSGHLLSEAPVSIIDRSNMPASSNTNGGSDRENAADIEIKPIGITQELNENTLSFADEMEAVMWDLPEPDNPEDDVEGSVANNDDDEKVCCSGTDWAKSSSLSSIPDEGNGSCKVKEEMKKAVKDVVTGKLKAIVVQLFRSIGIESSVEDGESWVDIVTSLSWEAASFLKPDAIGGKAMGLDGHVKVKCIASGTRSQSQVVRGLVFKKHAAHKHMPTQYKNPRLLLIQGVLGQSSDGLSSFNAMKLQGDAHLKTVIEMIETCHPNVILVEKTVSRDVQESIFKNGMTLVLDMKLHRLERIALCTGSSIVSTDTSTTFKLKQCDSFYFEKFVEEHANVGEGGKRPSKTLMFLEGCPKRLGCTILLKGSHSDELKAIKSVTRYSVLMAYHLILETSFLVGQRSMFSTVACPVITNSSQNNVHTPTSQSPDLYSPHLEKSASDSGSPVIDVPISNGFQNEVLSNSNKELVAYSPLSYEPYNPVIFSGFSSLSASLKKVIGDSFPLASTYPSLSTYFGLTRNEHNGRQTVTAASLPTNPEEVGANEIEIKDISDELKCDSDGFNQSSISSPKMHSKLVKEDVENSTKNDDEVNTVVNSQSILVLMSRRNTKGIICEQSHFSRITFYRDFDIPLGKFLQNNILNQRSKCSTCGELPEAHHYYYAHHNKQLTIQVKRLPNGKRLPGEREGKLWMWSRCGKCKPENGVPRSTKRVLISSPARVLSLGKFLDLSFSQTVSSIGLSSCGHSFPKDFLHFFGLGPVAAMFRYSPVTTYTVSTPPQKLDFNYSFDSEWLRKEIDRVRKKWVMVVKEVESSLKMIKSKREVSTLPHRSLLMDFFDIEEMLKQEYRDFEANFNNSVNSCNPGEAVYKPLNLNRLLWEVLLEAYIWDQRLNSLLSLGLTTAASFSSGKATDSTGRENAESDSGSNGFPGKEIPIEEQDDQSAAATENVASPKVLSDQELLSRQNSLLIVDLHQSESNVSLVSQSSFLSNLKNSKGWFWKPFREIRQIYINDIKRGYSPRTEPLSTTATYLPNVHLLISDEGSRLHISLGGNDHDDGFIVSDHEGELSSIIACALALLKDKPSMKDTLPDDGHSDGESVHNLIRNPSVSSTHLYSDGSVDSGVTPFSGDSRLSSFDGLALLDSLLPSENFKAEVSMGVTKSLGKGKYTVVCVYANDFQDLRSRCCPSEIYYIASLSRCRNWDAKGGKSKSFFSKTLDERFLIKEIKKTEFDSFEKFAPHYFKHMKQSFESRNQTCLAKILGIYQVTIRQPKSGKEVRHDLMVMENLTYGRNITRQYDLKGALHARFSPKTDGEDVLLDQNFVNDMNSSPLYVSNKAKHLLQRAVWNDTSFLNAINVMDYSLLVGVNTQKLELVCGIIDYLRQYTWDKQFETWVKSSLVPKNVSPTVISPGEYKKRFRKFMSAHFLCVPDDWCSEDSSDSFQLCRLNQSTKSPR